MSPKMSTVEKVEHALRTERDNLKGEHKIDAANAITRYLTEADEDSKTRLHDILMQVPATAEELLPEGREPGMFAVVASVNIDIDKITNAIVGAVENGYSGWMHAFEYSNDPVSMRLAAMSRGSDHTVWYNDPRFWQSGGKAVVKYDLPTEGEGEGNGQAVVGIDELKKGLNTMASGFARHFGDLANENDDATTHDVFLQCVILGDVVYG